MRSWSQLVTDARREFEAREARRRQEREWRKEIWRVIAREYGLLKTQQEWEEAVKALYVSGRIDLDDLSWALDQVIGLAPREGGVMMSKEKEEDDD
jgi:hypothetical protein